MKKLSFASMLLSLSFLFPSVSFAESVESSFGLVPIPVKFEIDKDKAYFTFKNNLVDFKYTSIEVEQYANALMPLRELLFKKASSRGIVLSVVKSTDTSFSTITYKKDESIKNPEAYILEINKEDILISASGEAGFFYAAQTLCQLAKFEKDAKGVENISFPCGKIVDEPRFKWRGLMIDSCRHYQDLDELKKIIDMLASQKMNTFHWHLTDDQAWRIEIKKYPKLIEKAAWRNGIGFGLDPKDTTFYNKDGLYGGFYSQDQIRELIKYAQDRYITIIPEIELPGHALAALTVYPEFGCTGGPYKMGMRGGVYDDVYCAGNNATYQFLENVLDEVVALFPSKIIHIGGDECPKVRWQKCPKCQAKIKTEGLKNEHELQSYVIRHMEKYLSKKGRRLIGWDEILEGGLAPNAMVMSWRGANGGIAAAKMGHDVVMSPNSHCYIDYYQARKGEPKGIGGFLPLERVYQFNPGSGIPKENMKHILGGQANLWTEYIPNNKHLEYMIAPRISAIAESVWSPLERKNWNDFLNRMRAQYRRFEEADFNYRRPTEIEIKQDDAGLVFLSSVLDDVKIFYTLDGSEPTEKSAEYTAPISLKTKKPILLKAAILGENGISSPSEKLLNRPEATITTENINSLSDHTAELAFDMSRETFFWSSYAPNAGATLTIAFKKPQAFKRIRVITGKNLNGGGKDALENGFLEIFNETLNCQSIPIQNGVGETEIVNGNVSSICIRVAKPQSSWLIIREIEVEYDDIMEKK